MPKPVINNRINSQDVYGIVSRHDLWLNQGVKTTDSPTFANLIVSGETTVQGNLYVEGNTTILNTNVIEFEDNIVVLNRLETGEGITLNQSGIEINRGVLENYRMVYNELDEMFKVGVISNLQAVANREDYPLQNGIMTWNDVTKRIESKGDISIDLIQTSSTNTTSASTGCIIVNGGIGIEKDIWSNGKIIIRGSDDSYQSSIFNDSNNLTFVSPVDITMSPTGNTIFPYNSLIALGSTSGSISADSITKDISIMNEGNVDFIINTNKKIRIPNQVPITFATEYEQIYTDSSNNMVIGGGEDILLEPGEARRVKLPVDIPLVFSNSNQQISANLLNDLSVNAGNNIYLVPGQGLNVCVSTDTGIKFGNSGFQQILSDSNDDLSILSANDIYLNPSGKINITSNIPITFGGSLQYIKEYTGNLLISAENNIKIVETDLYLTCENDSGTGTSGSIYTLGGIGVEKTIYTKTGLVVDTEIEGMSLIVSKGSQDLLKIDTTDSGGIDINTGDGLSGSLNIKSISDINFQSLLQLKTNVDEKSGYSIGRGYSTLNSGRVLSLNIPKYSEYGEEGDKPKFVVTSDDCKTELFSIEADTGNITSSGTFGLKGTESATNSSTASFIVYGGLGVVKNIITNGTFKSNVDSENALGIHDTSENVVFNIDTIQREIFVNGSLVVNNIDNFCVNDNALITNTNVHLNNDDNSIDTSSGALVVSGGVAVQKDLRVAGDTVLYSTLDLLDNFIINVKTPIRSKDAATKEYVDLAALRGMYIKNSVQVTTITNMDLNTDLTIESVIDGYTLKIGDRVLIKDQDNQVENGMYIINDSGIPSRSSDLIDGDNAAGVYVFIQYGQLQGSTGWICHTEPGDDIVGTDPIIFVQFTGLGEVDAGDGLSKDFNRIDINVDDSSIEIVDDILRVKSTIAGTGLTGGGGIELETKSDQSHVTKLGTIETGVWESSTIQVPYGGTGSTFFSSGNLLFGNDTDGILADSNLYYDNTNSFLGIGTDSPFGNLHLASTADVNILLDADTNSTLPNSRPQIEFAYAGDTKASIGMSRNYDDFSNNIYPDALVINNTSNIQLSTNSESRITILSNGNVGINTSTPSVSFEVAGTFKSDGLVIFASSVDSTDTSEGSFITEGGVGIQKNLNVGGNTVFYNETPSTSSLEAAVVIKGGLSIGSGENAFNIGNGGSLTVLGGASISGDIYIGGAINASGSSSSTFAYLTLTATDAAKNLSTGSLVTFGGLVLQTDENATSLDNGGALLTPGGGSFGGDLYIGGSNTVYGVTNYYSLDTNVMSFYDGSTLNLRYTLDRDIYDNEFSLSRYNNQSNFIEKVFSIDGSDGTVIFNNITPSSAPSSASFVLTGGISINSTNSAKNLTNGGCITAMGGLSVSKNVLIGDSLTIFSTNSSTSTTHGALTVSGGVGINKNLNIGGSLSYIGNGKFDVIDNTSGSTLWTYIGEITDKCKVQFTNNNYMVEIVSYNNNITHNTLNIDSGLIISLYQDTSNKYHLFSQTPLNSKTFINVLYKTESPFVIINEGISTTPSGVMSGYTHTWTELYNSYYSESGIALSCGDIVVQDFSSSDTFPIFGRNTINTDSSRDLGIAFQRYQSSNDDGSGEIVSDGYVFFDSLPNQVTANDVQVKFSNLTNSADDYYNGWWIKVVSGTNFDQVRQIVSYNGAQRIAEIDIPWTDQNPKNGDTVYFYNSQYVSLYFQDSIKRFNLVYNTRDTITKEITSYDYVDMGVRGLTLSSTDSSTNASNGSIYTTGGLSISNTTDSVNSSNGGTITTLGGAAISKKLYVGNSIGIGESDFDIKESLHIKQQVSTIRLENDYNSVSYIDFVKSGTGSCFGVLSDSVNDQFSLTFTAFNITPDYAKKIFTITTDGYIGINTTTNINSPFTIKSNNFISSDTTNGYLGLIAASTNDINSNLSAKVVVHGNNSIGSIGNVFISSSSSGSVILCTRDNVKQLKISNDSVDFYCTKNSTNSSTGGLIINGGVSVNCNANSTSITNGGSLTVAGGSSVSKDLYVGGNLYVDGYINVSSSVIIPDITFSNAVNCTFGGYSNNKLLPVINEAMLSFSFTAIPISDSKNCYIEFSLPNRTTIFDTRTEIMTSVSGYTDDANVIPIFNIACFGVKNQKRALVTFQSVSTSIHYFTVIARYTMI
jgi:hypothetical protein